MGGVDAVVDQAPVRSRVGVLLPCPAVAHARAEPILVVAGDIAEPRVELVVVVDVPEIPVGTSEPCEPLDALGENAARVERAGNSQRREDIPDLACLVAE